MSTRWREGGVTVTLTGDLEAWAERAIKAALGGAVEVVQAELETVARDAEAAWYGSQGVQRVTGKSGDMAVVTVLDIDRGRVLVSVGSTDDRVSSKGTKYHRADGTAAQRQAGAPIPSFVHRPTSLASTFQVVSHKEFFDAPKSTRIGRARKAQPGIAVGDYLVRVSSPRASDGKKLLPLFVNAPGKRALKLAVPALARIMAERIERTPNASS